MKIIRLLQVISLMLLLSCSENSDNLNKIDSKALGDIEVYLLKPNVNSAGATVSEIYEVWISSISEGEDAKKQVLLADKVDNLKVKWINDSTIQICFVNAQIHDYSNFFTWLSPKTKKLTEINVQLKNVKNVGLC